MREKYKSTIRVCNTCCGMRMGLVLHSIETVNFVTQPHASLCTAPFLHAELTTRNGNLSSSLSLFLGAQSFLSFIFKIISFSYTTNTQPVLNQKGKSLFLINPLFLINCFSWSSAGNETVVGIGKGGICCVLLIKVVTLQFSISHAPRINKVTG